MKHIAESEFHIIADTIRRRVYVIDDELKNAIEVITKRCRIDPQPYCRITCEDLATAIANPPDYNSYVIETGDIIVFPKWEQIHVLSQQISPRSTGRIYLIEVLKNGDPAFINMRDLRYTPQTNMFCVSSLQQKLSRMNLHDTVKELSGKVIRCLYKSLDLIAAFNENGSRKMECTRVIDGVPILQQVYVPKFVPFLVKE